MTIRTGLILDLETSGVDPKVDAIVEVGMALYSFRHHAIVRATSFLVDAGCGNAAEATNGIPVAMLIDDGDPMNFATDAIRKWMGEAGVLIGHNLYAFDRLFLPAELRTVLPIVDTMTDIEWPKPSSSKSLVATALAHGLGVSHAHRALVDCDLIARLFQRVHELGHDVQAMLARAMRPKAEVVSLAPFDEKDVVKAAGFAWDPTRKVWHRRMAQEDVAALPFQVRRG